MAQRSDSSSKAKADERDAAPERRRSSRTGLLQPAQLVWFGGLSDCLICDLSPEGAGLRFPDGLPSGPEEGEAASLEIPGMGRLACRVAWRREDMLGLRFRDSPAEVFRVLGGLGSSYREVS